jgi:uncharacterized membrane protein
MLLLRHFDGRIQPEGCRIVAPRHRRAEQEGQGERQGPGKGGVGATVGAVGGNLLSLIGGPAGLLAWIVGDAVVVGVAGKHLGRPTAEGDLKELGKALASDSSAVLLLLEDSWSEDAIDSMWGYGANVATLTVGDELSGQIAQYLADAITDEQGNVEAFA